MLQKKTQRDVGDHKVNEPVCACFKKKANSTLGCINKTVTCNLREAILPFYSALVRPHLVLCVQLLALIFNKDVDKLEESSREQQK